MTTTVSPAPELPAPPRPTLTPAPRRPARLARKVIAIAAGHRAMTVLLLAGLLVRVVAQVAYRPALWFNDAFEYVSVAVHPTPYPIRPSGYSFFLAALEPAHSVALVVAVQHLMGLAVGVLCYTIARRCGLPAWAGCAAAAPVVLDAYEVQLEHILLSDTLCTLLVLAAVAVTLRPRRPTVATGTLIGLLLAAAVLTRPAALPLLPLVGVALLVRRIGWRPAVALGVALALPIAAYASWYRSTHGTLALSNSTGVQLYGRVAGFADCRLSRPPARLAPLCPPPRTGQTAPAFIWHDSPLTRLPGPTFTAATESLAKDFAVHTIRRQPGDYLHAVGVDLRRAFSWERGPWPNAYTVRGYRFSLEPWPVTDAPLPDGRTPREVVSEYEQGDASTRISEPMASALIRYQTVVAVRGPMLAAMFAVALLGLLVRTRRTVPLLPALLVTASGLALLLVPILTVQVDYRYMQPSLPFAGLAAVLGAHRLAAAVRVRRSAPGRAGRADSG